MKGLSLRAKTAIGVFCFELYCDKNNIKNKDIDLFNVQMLRLLEADNIPKWDRDCNQIEITGMGDPLPKEIIEKYPLFADNILIITENIREITASQMYGGYTPKGAIQFLKKAIEYCEIDLDKFIDVKIFKEHKPGLDGWGNPLDIGLIEKWTNKKYITKPKTN